MPNYVKIRKGVVTQYPINQNDLSIATGMEYPGGATERDFLNYGCYPVKETLVDTSQEYVKELIPVKENGSWVTQWEARPFTSKEKNAKIEACKIQLLERIHEKQIETEDSGMDVGGVFVETTDGSLSKIMGALDESRGKSDVKRKFNHRQGRIELTLSELEAFASAIRQHKQDANDWGYDLAELTDAAETIKELQEIENLI